MCHSNTKPCSLSTNTIGVKLKEFEQELKHWPVCLVWSLQYEVYWQKLKSWLPQAQLLSKLFKHALIQFPVDAEKSSQYVVVEQATFVDEPQIQLDFVVNEHSVKHSPY